jgi:cyclase
MHLKKITEHVYVQDEWRGANTSIIVTNEGVVLIDVPPEIPNAKEWRKIAEGFGPIRYVINTESHHDHWITDSVFGGIAVAHEATRDAVAVMNHDFIRGRTNFIYTERFDYPDEFPIRIPEVSFTGDMTIHIGGLTIQLLHTPGHTEGQICVYIPEEKILFAADTVLNGVRTPFHDSISDKRWLASLKRLADLDFEYLISGHGSAPSGRELLEQQTKIIEGFFASQDAGKFEGNHITAEVHKAIDPNYDFQPRGVHPEGVVLAPLDDALKSGKHGEIN